MKKLLAILLVLVMVFALVACGAKPDEKPDDTAEKKTDTKEPANDEAEKATFEATFFTVEYDDEDWYYLEDEMSDYDSYSLVNMYVDDPEDEDSYLISAQLEVSIEDPSSFRSDLLNHGFDAYEYAENKAYDTVSIGGVDFLKHDTEYWGDPSVYYFARIENAGATASIRFYGSDMADERIAELISGITFDIPDTGNVEAPWPWNGTPFSQEPHSTMAGTYTLNSTWLPISECLVTNETFDHDIAASGNTVYLLVEGLVKQYSYDGAALTFVKDITLDEEGYECIQVTDDGSLWASSFMRPLVSYKDGVKTASYDDLDKVSLHPSGTWGLSWFSSNECEKITISGATVSKTPITFAEVKMLSEVIIDDANIFISGSSADDSGHKIFVYDHNGTLKYTLCDEDGTGLGSVTFMAQTANGFIAFDGNMRSIYLWTADGTFIAEIDDADIFGTYYPWFCSSVMLDDASIITIMTEDRADESAMELVAFAVKGF